MRGVSLRAISLDACVKTIYSAPLPTPHHPIRKDRFTVTRLHFLASQPAVRGLGLPAWAGEARTVNRRPPGECSASQR